MRLPDFVCGCGVNIVWAAMRERRMPLEFDPDGDLTVLEDPDGDWRVYDPETDGEIVADQILTAAGVKTLRSHLYRCGRLTGASKSFAEATSDPYEGKKSGAGLNRAQRRALAKRARRKR